jgi:ABC-type nitrate/sulfonate/bicarbonate transport system permease component
MTPISIGDRDRERGGATMSAKTRDRLLRVLSPLLLLAVWQAGAYFHFVDQRFFPSPISIFGTMIQMLSTGELFVHLAISLQRILIGFALGAIPGIIIGLAMGLWAPVRAIIEPLVDATFPIPKIAILPLFIMIFGLGEESKYAIIATAVIYLVLINTAAGVKNIDRIYMDVGRNFGAGRWLTFTDIALPGALPLILAGLKLGMGVALLVIVSAEFVGARSGIGYLIWTSWQVFEVDKMYVGLMVSALMGFGASIGLGYLERSLVPWTRPAY